MLFPKVHLGKLVDISVTTGCDMISWDGEGEKAIFKGTESQLNKVMELVATFVESLREISVSSTSDPSGQHLLEDSQQTG